MSAIIRATRSFDSGGYRLRESLGIAPTFPRLWDGLPGPAGTALITVVREIPSLLAICAFGTPSPASRRIDAQSSKVITLQSWW